MDFQFVKNIFTRFPYRLGIPQQSGTITMLPLFGFDRSAKDRFIAPLSGLKLSKVQGFNAEYGLANRGHLEQIISRKRGFLTQYQNRLELLPQQTGAIFFFGDRLVGLEIAPTAAYFKELWMPLVCFCYGVAAMHRERAIDLKATSPTPFKAKNLKELREQLQQSRIEKHKQVINWLAQIPPERFVLVEEEKFLDLQLKTLIGSNLAGQFVEEKGDLIYASLFAKNF